MKSTQILEEIKKLFKANCKLSAQDIANKYDKTLRTGQNYIKQLKEELNLVKDENNKYYIKNSYSGIFIKLQKLINNYIQIEINLKQIELKIQSIFKANNIEFLQDSNDKIYEISKIKSIKRIKKESLHQIQILIFKDLLVDKLQEEPILISQIFTEQPDNTYILSGEVLNINRLQKEITLYFPNLAIVEPKTNLSDLCNESKNFIDNIEVISNSGLDL